MVDIPFDAHAAFDWFVTAAIYLYTPDTDSWSASAFSDAEIVDVWQIGICETKYLPNWTHLDASKMKQRIYA